MGAVWGVTGGVSFLGFSDPTFRRALRNPHLALGVSPEE